MSGYKLGSSTEGLYYSEESPYFYQHFKNPLYDLISEYNNYLEQAISDDKSPGAAIAVVYRGDVLLTKGYGVRNISTGGDVNENTVFRLGSVSKGFASVLTGIMVQEGMLNWDDCVTDIIPDLNLRDKKNSSLLTVRHILGQATGLPSHAYTDMLDAGVPYEKIKTLLSNLNFVAVPGQIYSYQNVAYSLISDVLKNRSAHDYNQLLKEKIFLPLNMTNASTDYKTISEYDNSAYPHLKSGYSWRARPFNERYYSASPASGVNASAKDLASWLLALTGSHPDIIAPEILNEISQEFVITPANPYRNHWHSITNAYYGLGWRVFNYKNHKVIYHGGYVEGFRTEIAFDPVEKIGIAVMFNSNTTFASDCIPDFLEEFYNNVAQQKQVPLYTSTFPVYIMR